MNKHPKFSKLLTLSPSHASGYPQFEATLVDGVAPLNRFRQYFSTMNSKYALLVRTDRERGFFSRLCCEPCQTLVVNALGRARYALNA
jgi:hypothetical protein